MRFEVGRNISWHISQSICSWCAFLSTTFHGCVKHFPWLRRFMAAGEHRAPWTTPEEPTAPAPTTTTLNTIPPTTSGGQWWCFTIPTSATITDFDSTYEPESNISSYWMETTAGLVGICEISEYEDDDLNKVSNYVLINTALIINELIN